MPGLQQFSTPAVELGSMQLTHLGWSDYTGNGGDRATVWNMNSLAYYDTASTRTRTGVGRPGDVVSDRDGRTATQAMNEHDLRRPQLNLHREIKKSLDSA